MFISPIHRVCLPPSFLPSREEPPTQSGSCPTISRTAEWKRKKEETHATPFKALNSPTPNVVTSTPKPCLIRAYPSTAYAPPNSFAIGGSWSVRADDRRTEEDGRKEGRGRGQVEEGKRKRKEEENEGRGKRGLPSPTHSSSGSFSM
jgi:hypothetical protein